MQLFKFHVCIFVKWKNKNLEKDIIKYSNKSTYFNDLIAFVSRICKYKIFHIENTCVALDSTAIWPFICQGINVSIRSLTRYCLQCLLCLTVQRFFFLEAPVVKPFPDFSLWGVDRFPLFAGIAVILNPQKLGCFTCRRLLRTDAPFSLTTKVIDNARNFSLLRIYDTHVSNSHVYV